MRAKVAKRLRKESLQNGLPYRHLIHKSGIDWQLINAPGTVRANYLAAKKQYKLSKSYGHLPCQN